MRGEAREISLAQWMVTASTSRTLPSTRTAVVARCTVSPTAVLQANSILPRDAGIARRSCLKAPGSARLIGCIAIRSYHSTMRLVLASTSPRRMELLRRAGFVFEILAVDVDERTWPNESPSKYVRRLAAEKSARAMAVIIERNAPVSVDVVVLAADTAVVVDDAILGKPHDDQDARAMLGQLSGRSHEVLTAVSFRSGASELGEVEITTVWFAPLSPEDIEWHVASGEGHDKAGAYAIQGRASRFILRIEGSYSNVVGLPMARVFELLRRIGQA